MAATIPLPAPPKKKSRLRLRYSLRTLLLTVALVGVPLGYFGNILVSARHEHAVFARLKSKGVDVSFGREYESGHDPSEWSMGERVWRTIRGARSLADVEDFGCHDNVTDEDLELLVNFPRLRGLSLSGHGISDKGARFIAGARKLQHLSLLETHITSRGIAQLSELKHLSTLDFLGESVSDETLETLDVLGSLDTLTLARTNVTNEGLAHLSDLTRLRTLQLLQNSDIDGDGLRHLHNLRELEKLSLWRANVNDKDLRHLTQSEMNSSAQPCNLKHLVLDGSSITDEGMIEIAKLRDLKILWISNTAVTDAGLRHLQSLPNLVYLRVGPNVSLPAVDELSIALPKCFIVGFDSSGHVINIRPKQ